MFSLSAQAQKGFPISPFRASTVCSASIECERSTCGCVNSSLAAPSVLRVHENTVWEEIGGWVGEPASARVCQKSSPASNC